MAAPHTVISGNEPADMFAPTGDPARYSGGDLSSGIILASAGPHSTVDVGVDGSAAVINPPGSGHLRVGGIIDQPCVVISHRVRYGGRYLCPGVPGILVLRLAVHLFP
jgi:hypothetical protein